MKDIKFNIIGYGSEFNKLQKLVEKINLNNFFFHKNANWREVLFFYKESDILYAQLTKNFSLAVPSKLYQYLCSKRFVIYGGNKIAKELLSKFSQNIVISPGNINELYNAIILARKLINKQNNYNKNLKIIKLKYLRENNVLKVFEKLNRI